MSKTVVEFALKMFLKAVQEEDTTSLENFWKEEIRDDNSRLAALDLAAQLGKPQSFETIAELLGKEAVKSEIAKNDFELFSKAAEGRSLIILEKIKNVVEPEMHGKMLHAGEDKVFKFAASKNYPVAILQFFYDLESNEDARNQMLQRGLTETKDVGEAFKFIISKLPKELIDIKALTDQQAKYSPREDLLISNELTKNAFKGELKSGLSADQEARKRELEELSASTPLSRQLFKTPQSFAKSTLRGRSVPNFGGVISDEEKERLGKIRKKVDEALPVFQELKSLPRNVEEEAEIAVQSNSAATAESSEESDQSTTKTTDSTSTDESTETKPVADTTEFEVADYQSDTPSDTPPSSSSDSTTYSINEEDNSNQTQEEKREVRKLEQSSSSSEEKSPRVLRSISFNKFFQDEPEYQKSDSDTVRISVDSALEKPGTSPRDPREENGCFAWLRRAANTVFCRGGAKSRAEDLPKLDH